MLRRIVLALSIMLGIGAHLAGITTAVGVILVRMLLAALSAILAAFSAFFAAALVLVLARTFRATLRAFGTTRFGFLLIGLRSALRTLGHRDRESSQQEGEQHNEYSALSGFHFVLLFMMITGRTPAHTLMLRVRLWRVNPGLEEVL
jgi:hypothetical protein